MNVGCFETGLFGVWASWHWLNWILCFLKLAKLECIIDGVHAKLDCSPIRWKLPATVISYLRSLCQQGSPIAWPVMTKRWPFGDTFCGCHHLFMWPKNVTFLSPILVNRKNKTYVFFCHKIVTVFSERVIFISKSSSFLISLNILNKSNHQELNNTAK
jgi:hypothetical protein